MHSKRVASKNADFQKFEVLKSNRNKRHRYGEFLVEGVRNINQAVENNWHITALLYAGDTALSQWAQQMLSTVQTKVNYELTAPLMMALSEKTDVSELMAVVQMKGDSLSRLPLGENPLLVLFDRPSNKGNLGTLIRSCDFLGADGLIVTGHGVDLYDKEVVSATMGSFFHFPVVQVPERQTLQLYFQKLASCYPGFHLVGTTSHEEAVLYQAPLSGPLLLMLGNETEGLSYGLKEACDLLVTIPKAASSAATSFNVSCAATAILSEITRQRMFG